MLSDQINRVLCTRCGGACCKSGNPGVSTPEDWGADKPAIRLALMKALVSKRYVMNVQPETSYWTVRPAVLQNKHCVFLGQMGCTLDHKPEGCRTLIPSKNFPSGCVQPDDVHERGGLTYWGERWLPYRAVLDEIAQDLNIS